VFSTFFFALFLLHFFLFATDMENDSKSPSLLSEDSFDDTSSRQTLALDLGESTPAPAHFREQPLATGAREYSWAARVDKLTLRLDKLDPTSCGGVGGLV
jgi:hypothetical protein